MSYFVASQGMLSHAWSFIQMYTLVAPLTRPSLLHVNLRRLLGPGSMSMETGISEASKRVSIFSFATQGGKQVSFYFRQRNWVQAREAQIRFPAG